MKRRYVLHGVAVLIVLAAMAAPAWLHLDWTSRYLLGTLAIVGCIVVIAIVLAALFIRR